MPRVTVCIPTYDRTQWLAEAIASALGQTFEDLVVEIHDDATPSDAVADVVAQFDDPRLRLIRHESNAGIVGNFTRSLLGATTDYVLQLGDDDIAAPDLVARTVAALDTYPTAGMAHARFSLIDDAGGVLVADEHWLGAAPAPALEAGSVFLEKSMAYGCRVCSSTALIRRSAVPEGAFLQQDHPPFDFAFWLRMARSWDIAFVDAVLCAYRVHARSFTSGISNVTEVGYSHDERSLHEVLAVKLRYGSNPRLARKAFRRDLVYRVRERTLPERPFGETARALVDVARRQPSVWLEPTAWALLAGSAVGPRTVDRLKGRA
ncbi:MAG TPA: glycosyltransferase [Solirubrobacter sp.]|nr:glycosyltransferase [Solirubrobacter sp.]